jgi:hypothetical protein
MSQPTEKAKKSQAKGKPQVRDLNPKKDAKGGTSFNYTKPVVTYDPQKP